MGAARDPELVVELGMERCAVTEDFDLGDAVLVSLIVIVLILLLLAIVYVPMESLSLPRSEREIRQIVRDEMAKDGPR